MMLLYLFLAAMNGFAAGYLAWLARKTWKHLPKGLRALDVVVIATNVALGAMNLARAFT